MHYRIPQLELYELDSSRALLSLSPASLVLPNVVLHKVSFLNLPCPYTLIEHESSRKSLESLFNAMAFAMRDTRDRSLAAKWRPKSSPLLVQDRNRIRCHRVCYARGCKYCRFREEV